MPEIESKTQAEQRVRQQIHDGADAIKIFASSIERDDISNFAPKIRGISFDLPQSWHTKAKEKSCNSVI